MFSVGAAAKEIKALFSGERRIRRQSRKGTGMSAKSMIGRLWKGSSRRLAHSLLSVPGVSPSLFGYRYFRSVLPDQRASETTDVHSVAPVVLAEQVRLPDQTPRNVIARDQLS